MEKKSSSSHRQKEPVPTIHPETSASPASATFPIVGIGASAGGLEALDQFLGRVPTGSGMAFVIVQHLDPTLLDDLGLIPALHTFMKDFMKRTGVRASLTAYAAVNQLPISQSAVLYRVALEALNNVTIHEQASAVEVQIKKLQDWICLTITDYGKSSPAVF